MNVSPEAETIIREARFNPHVPENIVLLIEKHGIAAAAEAICLLVQVTQAGPNVPYRSKP